MHVGSGIDVVEHVSARVVEVLVNNKIITTVQTPVQKERPIPSGYLKIESAADPEPVTISVDTKNVEAKIWAGVRKAAVVEGVLQMKPPVPRGVVPEPLIMIDMLAFIQLPIW